MATLDDVRAIALALPETFEKVDGHRGGATWRTKKGAFVWEREPGKTDLAQLEAAGRAWPEGPVIGIRTEGLEGTEELLAAFPDRFFTIPHFAGYPAVLARLDVIDADHLREVITDAWLVRASGSAAKALLADQG